jgi:hypothetical protein
MRSKKHGIILIIISSLFFYNKDVYSGLFLVTLGAALLYKWWKHPLRALEQEIKGDAQKFNIKIPTSYPLHMEFINFYSKYLRLSTQFPALKTTYTELVESMWLRLSSESDSRSWRNIIRKTDENWPVPLELKNLLETKLNKVSKETRYWEEAMANSN